MNNPGNLLNYYNDNDELQPNQSFHYSRSRSSEKGTHEEKQRGRLADYTAFRSKSQETKGRLQKPKNVKLVKNEDLNFNFPQSIMHKPQNAGIQKDRSKPRRNQFQVFTGISTISKDESLERKKRAANKVSFSIESPTAGKDYSMQQKSKSRSPKRSKNAQIHSKFKMQEKEIPLVSQQTKTQKLVSKMRHLSQQRRVMTTAPTANVKKTIPAQRKKESSVKQTQQQTPRTMQGQYDLRKMRMDSRLNEQVHKHVFVQPKDDAEPLDLDLIPGHDSSPARAAKSGYARNMKTVAMRVDDELMMNVNELDNQKIDLIQQLNRKLVELDRVNEDKRVLNEELIKQIKFVREMQAQLGTDDNTNVADIIDKNSEEQLKAEKKKGVQLREQVKELEIERKEILAQLKLLQGDKDVTIVERRGNEMNLQKAMMGVNEMLRYRETVLQDIDIIQRDYSALSQDDQNISRHLSHLNEDFAKVQDDRARVAEQVRHLQSQYDQTYFRNEQELREMAYSIRMEKSQKSCKQFLNSLHLVFERRKLAYFQELIFNVKSDENQISSVLAFRKLLYNYREQRQRKYIQLWFLNALQPNKVMRVNRDITNWLLRYEMQATVLRSWNNQMIISQQQTSFRIQCIKKLTNCFKNYGQRCLRTAMDQWRMCKTAQHLGKNRVVKFVRQRMEMKQKEAIQRWKNIIWEENENIKLHNQKVRFTTLTFKQALFYAWKIEAKNLKSLRISLQLRVITALKKNAQRQQLKMNQGLFLIKLESECTKNLVRICFRALRLSKEQDKQDKVFTRLDGQENAQIEADTAEIKKVRDRSQKVALKRAVKQGILSPFTKVLKSYFEKWKQETKTFKVQLNDKIKLQIIKIYKNKLSEAFEKWKQKGSKKKRRKKMMVQQEIQQENEALQEEIRQETQKIEQAEVRSMQKGNTKVKKMLKKAYETELKYWLMKWKNIIETKNKTVQKLDKAVLQKMKKRFYREAFDKFKHKTERKAQMAKNEVRAEDLTQKWNKKSLKKCYNAWFVYSNTTIKARNKFKKILTTEYTIYMKKHFLLWKQFREKKAKKGLRKKQKMMTEVVQTEIDNKGEIENQLFEQQKKEKEMVRAEQSLSKKTMKKFISQWRNCMYYDAFMLWKMSTRQFKQTKSLVNGAIFLKKLNRTKKDAFTRWRQNLHLKFEKERKFSTQCEIENEQVQEEQLSMSRTRIKQTKEMTVYRVNKLKKKQEKAQKLAKNNIKKIIKDKNDNFIVPKIQQIFDVWRQIASHRAKHLKALAEHMKKNLLQHGFDNLCVSQYNTLKHKQQYKKMKNFFNQQVEFNIRGAFDKWKYNLYKEAVTREKKISEENYHAQKNSDIIRERITQKRAEFFEYKTKRNLTKECFIVLFDYRCKKQFQRAQQQVYKEKEEAVFMKYDFQKWVLRSDHSIIQRQKMRIMKRFRDKVYKRLGFNALAKQKLDRLKLKKLLERIRHNYQREVLRDSFEEIKFVADNVGIKLEEERNYASRVISETAIKAYHKNLKLWFDKFLTKGKDMDAKKKKTHQFLTKAIGRKYKEVFNTWKKNSDMLEVIRFNNEEGPVRMEVIQIQQEVRNLRAMLKDKMILPTDELIDALLNENEAKYKNLVDKSLCRFFLFGEGQRGENDEWLKAYCIDQWKKHMIEKKKAEPLMHLFETLAKNDPLEKYFHLWKKKTDQIMKTLMGMTQEQLFNRDSKNVRQLADCAEAIEDLNTEIGDLKQQRDYLVDKVVIGQRLALSRCKFSFTFASMKVWVKLELNSSTGFKKAYAETFGASINNLAENKQRIQELEQMNMDIAEQNDALKEGAQEGVQNLQELESVQKEVEKLNDQLVEQADQIKQLLAENKKLKKLALQQGNNDDLPEKG